MSKEISRWIVSLQKYANRPWYIPLVGFLALLDHFVFVIPTDALLISTVMLKKRKWIQAFLWVSIGSTLGAVLVAYLVQVFGEPMIQWLVGGDIQTEWVKTRQFIDDYGNVGIALLAFGPFPLAPGIIIAALAGMPLFELGIWTLLGRSVKYLIFSWAATHVPHLLNRFWGVKTELKDLLAAAREEKRAQRKANPVPPSPSPKTPL